MLQKDLNWWIEKIRKSEINVDTKNIKNTFIKKLFIHQEKLNKIINETGFIYPDSFGISGDNLFPITIDIINRERMPGDWKWVGHGKAICVVYYGICPELENFVSIILWSHESSRPEYMSTAKKAYRNIEMLIKNDPYHQKVLSFSGNYRLNLPNEIRPFRSKINSIPKPKAVYDWLYVPYLKEVGETFLSHKSPLNFTRVFLREPNNTLTPKYINFKTTMGKFLEKRKSIAKFRLIFVSEKNFYRSHEIKLHHSIIYKINKLEKGDLVALLVGEIINSKPEMFLIDIEKVKSLDVFSHIILFKLYNIFLEKERLLLMSWNEFIKLYRNCIKITRKFCGELDPSIGFNIDLFFKFHLEPFVQKIDKNIYYIPAILNKLKIEDIKLFDEKLRDKQKTLFDKPIVFDKKGNIRRDVYELQKRYNLLRLLVKMKLLIYKGVE